MRAIYLDYNSGAPVRPEAARAMADALAEAGNPSSVHACGRAARRRIEGARDHVAVLVGCEPAGLVFTSGGTEANALALRGAGRARVLVSAVEHPSVADAVPGAGVIPVDGNGVVVLDALDWMLADDERPALVSVMAANNETGVVQPVSDIVHIARRHGALVHCDAAQAVGRMVVSIGALGVDFLSVSAHKLGGPAGVGALALADPDFPLAPILLGGGQERRRRSGTENVAGIAGFGAAARSALDEVAGDAILVLCDMRDRLEARIKAIVPGAVVVAEGAGRLGNTSCLVLPGVSGQTQVMALDLTGIMVSAGAACSSGKVAAGRVLAAMGLGAEMANSAVRVSLGWGSRPEDCDEFLQAWCALARRKGFRIDDAAEAA